MSLLIDKYGRQLNYLRLSVTDRCNFRCYYCMPEEGVEYAKRTELLSLQELYTLSEVFCSLGVSKIRITGGEPFMRKDLVPFLQKISRLPELTEISITTNGTRFSQHLPALQQMGIRKINLSLDSLDRERFREITRRDSFEEVYGSIFQLLERGFEVKLNCVVAASRNTDDILPFIELTREHPLSVRFLEEMPFNGTSTFDLLNWNHKDIYQYISQHYPDLQKLQSEATSTSVNYKVPGYVGTFGIIPSFSRTFCGTCNRIRLSATGELRTCLYGVPAANLRDLLRQGASAASIAEEIVAAVGRREKDGYAAEAHNQETSKESMSVLGG
ncbi:GTP 3',8-cyclase MoaA [Pontibacter chitinilyticus]|uniref:GTP 3',8-cyclase MoaA n=1 Tax=Pontibacter chitinilyticus TaxID=2674989 RepID=UPI00321B8782